MKAMGIKVGNNAHVVHESRRKVGGKCTGLVLGAAVGYPS
jgi:hypothetical protein